MKGQKLFLKIYIPFVIVITVALIVLQILGSKTRIGYLDFNLNTGKTLELNNLMNIKEDFIIDDKLDKESLNNYLLTNENITNYVYHFRIRYYDKIFKHSDIYGVYPDLSNLPDYIKEAKMDPDGSPFGNFVSSKIIEEDRIDNVNYILKIKSSIVSIFILVLLILIIYLYNNIHKYIVDTNTYKIIDNFLTEKRFIILIIIIGFLLFIFQFWLGFPGYYGYFDGHYIFKEAFTNQYNNWHPIIIGLTLHILFEIFGYHTFYIFFVNLILWYGGLTLITISLYLKFKNRLSILLLLISFIGNIFFMNINHLKDTTSSLFVWFAYSTIFFQILINNKKIISKIILNLICFISLILGLLWRHNMIVTIYPIFIFYSIILIKKINMKNIKIKILSFICSMGIFAILLILIIKLFPLTVIKNTHNNAVNHLFYLQIAGIAVLSDDASIIPNDMYNNTNFEDVVKLYEKYPNFGDPYTGIFNYKSDLFYIWINGIKKHPLAYLHHIFNYSKGYLTTKSSFRHTKSISWILNPIAIQSKNKPFDFEENENYFWLNKGIEFNKLKFSIYSFIYNYKIHCEIYVYVIITLILFIFSIYLNIKYKLKIDLLIFLISVVSSSMATILIVLLFSPLPDYRYIYPICPISIISLISFITFIYDMGGFKKFFKELRGNKK